ncbi:MAG: 30S ribosomal protein S13 [Candidatus Thermoplasmatota archaeon]|nr:30S ribosomal protein S13 [Candidatus Thermoplasmatota archaeon]
MDDTSKSNEKVPEASSEKVKEEKVVDVRPEAKAEETPKEKIEEKSEPPKENKEFKEAEKNIAAETKQKEEANLDVKKEKTAKPKDKSEKKKGEKDDFSYIVRIANTDVAGEKTLARGLTSIKGIGTHMSILIIDMTGLDRNLKMGNLTDVQIETIKEALENATNNAPKWMLNHRKDIETGEDIHLMGAEIDMQLRDEINIMKKIRCYKGIRHERGLAVRGQRTRANNRKGLTLGVSKKRVLSGK